MLKLGRYPLKKIQSSHLKQVLPTFLKDFSTIKPGKYRVMLKPRGEGPPEEVFLHHLARASTLTLFMQAGFPGACIATQPLTLQKIVLKKDKVFSL